MSTSVEGALDEPFLAPGHANNWAGTFRGDGRRELDCRQQETGITCGLAYLVVIFVDYQAVLGIYHYPRESSAGHGCA